MDATTQQGISGDEYLLPACPAPGFLIIMGSAFSPMPHRAVILVVEDDDNNLLLLRHAFEQAGIVNPVQIATTGEAAIAYLGGTSPYCDWIQFPLPSMVLLDVKLPGMDGFEVLRWIRQQSGLRTLRVAMLTSSDFDQDITTAYEAGANAFLTKPLGFDNFVQMMRVFHAHWLEFAQAPTVSRAG